VGNEDCHGNVEQEDQSSDTKVDRWASESRVKNAERNTSRGETSSSGDISSSSESQIVQDRVHVNLGGKDLEDGRKRQEVLGQSKDCSASTTLGKFYLLAISMDLDTFSLP
jgi:hypothetical protein